MSDKKPAVPFDFPVDLKELVFHGYSKEPTERPALEDFQSALNKMLAMEEAQNLSAKKSSNEIEDDQVDPQAEVQLALEEKLRLESIPEAATEAGNSILNQSHLQVLANILLTFKKTM